jgi:hypothetical protein
VTNEGLDLAWAGCGMNLRVGKYFVCIFWLGAVILQPAHFCAAEEDVASIIRRSAEVNKRDWAAAPDFNNYERDRNKKGDKTYDVTMLYGSPYSRLIAVNGKPLSPSEQKEEQEKYDKAVKERQDESPSEKSKRIADYEADRKRDNNMMDQLTTAFNFRLVGQHHLYRHEVYVLKATPRPGYKPPNRDCEVLTGMEGTLWIDKKSFQWVKVEAHVIHPVRIEGFLAEVEPGTRFEVEKQPVAGDIWLTSHFSMRANARVLFVFSHTGEEDDSFFNYKRRGNDAYSSNLEMH